MKSEDMGGSGKPSHRGTKICCIVVLLLLVVIIVVGIALCFTVFKVREPEINIHPFGLKNIQVSFSPNLTVNGTLGMVITIENPNYGSFKHPDSTAYVNYHDVTIAEVPIKAEVIPPRSVVNVTTSASILGHKLVTVPSLLSDFMAGSINLTSTSALGGKVRMLKVIKVHGTVYTTCNISISMPSKDVKSACWTKLHL